MGKSVGAPEPALSLSKGLALFETWASTLPLWRAPLPVQTQRRRPLRARNDSGLLSLCCQGPQEATGRGGSHHLATLFKPSDYSPHICPQCALISANLSVSSLTSGNLAPSSSAAHAMPSQPLPQTTRHPCEDSAAQSPKAEYDRGLWRPRLLSALRFANAGTLIGAVPFRPVPLSLLNSNYGSGNCSSRQRRIPPRVTSAPGVSKTGIGSMSQNGYLKSGASPDGLTSGRG